jgi:hypothetical protein
VGFGVAGSSVLVTVTEAVAEAVAEAVVVDVALEVLEGRGVRKRVISMKAPSTSLTKSVVLGLAIFMYWLFSVCMRSNPRCGG